MPVGLVIMKWNERVGTELIDQYPEELNISDKTLMQVYSTHEYSGEAGLISLMVGSLNIASYYTGPDSQYYILLLLNIDEDPDSFEGGLADASRTILQNLEDDAYKEFIPALFRRISIYPTLNTEQQLAMTYENEVKRMIISRLQDEGVVSKSELSVWLKDRYKQGFVDIENLLNDLIKKELIKETSVKGMPSELIFLTNDIIMIRRPPIELLKDPSDHGLPSHLVEDYKMECKKFFSEYRPSTEDNLKIIGLITNPQVYETIRLLRTAIVTKNDLEKLKKKGVEDLNDVLKLLWENRMTHVFQDQHGNEYYTLLSDFVIERVFPKYLLNIIKKQYEQKSKADEVLVEYINVLEDTFTAFKEKKKKVKVQN
ncbi:MAG: hypothetical protein KGD63_14080 [Candidatus Lokiarchaeota archaeon]|nr:hypothetical protein [Candidatus Lokiarchaeota archaeon]